MAPGDCVGSCHPGNVTGRAAAGARRPGRGQRETGPGLTQTAAGGTQPAATGASSMPSFLPPHILSYLTPSISIPSPITGLRLLASYS